MYRIDANYAITSVVHDFGSSSVEGQSPRSIVEVASGKLIGFTTYGGYSNQGTVFAYESGSGVSTVLDLDSSTGSFAISAPILASDSHLYGTLSYGGSYGGGSLYRLEFVFSTYTFDLDVLYNIGGAGSPGSYPTSSLTETASGSFLGITQDNSTAFEFTP